LLKATTGAFDGGFKPTIDRLRVICSFKVYFKKRKEKKEGNSSFFHQHLYRVLKYFFSLENKLNFYLQQLLCSVTNTIFNLLFLLSTLTICFLHQRATTHPNPTINIFYYSFFFPQFFLIEYVSKL